jgi:hypothetical protein
MLAPARPVRWLVLSLLALGCSTKTTKEPFRGPIPRASLQVSLTTPDGEESSASLDTAYEYMTLAGFGCADRVDQIGATDGTEELWDLGIILYTTSYWSLGSHHVVWEEKDDPYHVAYADPLEPDCVRPVGMGVVVNRCPVDELTGTEWTHIEGDVTVSRVWKDGMIDVSATVDVLFEDAVNLPGATLRLRGDAEQEFVDERPEGQRAESAEPDPNEVPDSVWATERCQSYLVSSAKAGCVGEPFDTHLMEGGAGGEGGEGGGQSSDGGATDGGTSGGH